MKDVPLNDAARRIAENAKAWPFVEARKLISRHRARPEKAEIILETGYGPSGLPHIGTFGEVARTSMVRHALSLLTDVPSRLIAFSDDMDGMRSVPDNVPNREMMAEFLGRPLTEVPDPFGTHESFGHHNNARLRAFLDRFGFDYTFMSATEMYRSGAFDATLRTVLQHYDEVIAVVLPTLGSERRETYSPFLPIDRKTRRVLQTRIIETNADAGTVVFVDGDGRKVETPVTGGACKLQWKVDWAMRWVALGIDYEMSGKDLIDSVRLSSKICQILGGRPPDGFIYELFLDERGEKISKSRGNGLAVDDWLTYSSPESLALFMFQKPKSAKKLHFDTIPRATDDYGAYLKAFYSEEPAKHYENPVWHIHQGQPPPLETILNYSLLLNLVSVCHAETKSILWGFVSRYDPTLTPENAPALDTQLDYAIAYYRDFVKPMKRYRRPNPDEAEALASLAHALDALPRDAQPEEIQTVVYDVGKAFACFKDLKSWFATLYAVLLGQEMGPRLGSFIALYGIDETIALINQAIAGEMAARAEG